MLSRIGLHALETTSPLMEGLERVFRNPYDSINRPDGIINLGTAENKLMQNELLLKLKQVTSNFVTQELLYYGIPFGSMELRENLTIFFKKYFNCLVEPENIVVSSGCGSVVCNLAQIFLNPGDKVGIPIPFYGGFDFDLTLYTNAVISELKDQSDNDIKLLVLTNPQNPTGIIYDKNELLKWLNYAKKLDIPVILDEIYALSIFKDNDDFISGLEMELPDPINTHIVWSFSKDLCLNGLRLGVCISKSPIVLEAMRKISLFSNISSFSDRIATKLLSDHEWLDNHINENKSRLKKQYDETIKYLESRKIEYLPAKAGFFVWINLSFMMDPNLSPAQGEKDLWIRLINRGVLFSPGSAFHSDQPGWFRIVFTLPLETLMLGLDRAFNDHFHPRPKMQKTDDQ